MNTIENSNSIKAQQWYKSWVSWGGEGDIAHFQKKLGQIVCPWIFSIKRLYLAIN